MNPRHLTSTLAAAVALAAAQQACAAGMREMSMRVPLMEEAYGDRFGELSCFAVSAPAINGSSRFYQIDEFAVLGRKLTDAEIRMVYDAFGPRQVRQGPMGNDEEAR